MSIFLFGDDMLILWAFFYVFAVTLLIFFSATETKTQVTSIKNIQSYTLQYTKYEVQIEISNLLPLNSHYVITCQK